MRRLVGIPVRSAVAVALPLVGAMCVAAEIRQEMLRRDSEEASFQSVSSTSGDRVIGSSGDLISKSNIQAKAVISPANKAQHSPGQNDELTAEQQASQIPAQDSAQTPAQDEQDNDADTHTRQIIISIPDRRLALLEDGQLVKVYPIAVGASETPSPDGEFTIINHAVNPTYRHDGKEIGPGKGNPLGTRWMGLSLKGYGIHGTNVQSSVGKAASHGCFRMKKKDVEELYGRVQVGDQVTIRGERDELTASLFTKGTSANPVVAETKTEVQVASATTATTTVEEQ